VKGEAMIIRVRVENGVLVPLSPLPPEWKEGEVYSIRRVDAQIVGKGRILVVDPKSEFEITQARIVPGESISLEWQESNCKGELRATKVEGALYRGTWRYAGYQEATERGVVELAMYFAQEGSILLFGRWGNQKYGDQQFVMQILNTN
jgi:hypothetical protein